MVGLFALLVAVVAMLVGAPVPGGAPDYGQIAPAPAIVVTIPEAPQQIPRYDLPVTVDYFGEQVPAALDLYDWGVIAACESNGRWHIVDASGRFHGGLQLAIPGAERLSIADQLELAREKLDREGPGAWPVCAKHAGWVK